ncbi:MAG: hypothetical protein ABIA63_05835, partial [bacterium]
MLIQSATTLAGLPPNFNSWLPYRKRGEGKEWGVLRGRNCAKGRGPYLQSDGWDYQIDNIDFSLTILSVENISTSKNSINTFMLT